jgi:hypothetical protein
MKFPGGNQSRKRRLLVVVTLAIVMAATANQQDTEGVADNQRVPESQTIALTTATETMVEREEIGNIPLDRLKRTQINVKEVEIFGPQSWYIPPPPPPRRPPPPPPSPPPPSAPPLPFTFLGKMEVPGGKMTIYLEGRNRLYLVTKGETIDNTYHVDGIEAGQIALTYLPLKIKQYISMGEAP